MAGASADTDRELLAAIAVGDDDAFALFYRRYLDGVVAFLRRRVSHPELAFDLAAETFAALVVSASAYPEQRRVACAGARRPDAVPQAGFCGLQ